MRNATHGNTPTDLHRAARRHGCNALRAELHRAADPDRIAERRTTTALSDLRDRADWFRDAMEVYAGQPLGYWYCELATRFDRLANQIERRAEAEGIVGGVA